MQTIWYFPLEYVKSRYTEQLCKYWIPDAIEKNADFSRQQFKVIEGTTEERDIKVGQVLDATGRGKYSLSQINNFLTEIEKGNVKNNDILYIQDFWTPGLEAIFYALHLYNIKLYIYSMCHAQSVDEYDFTYSMREWMRPIELGYDRMHTGIFVGSSIHRQQMRDAGFRAPIHVVSLPISEDEVKNRIKNFKINTEKAIVFSSRLDKEKNPEFMLKLAKTFLRKHRDWKFYISTSSKQLRSNDSDIINKIKKYAKQNKRFIIKENLSKDEYYQLLCKCKIQLNTSLQDYVSWTLLEASLCGCELCYPDYRSFPECVPDDRRYKVWQIKDAMRILNKCIKNPRTHYDIPKLSDVGRLVEGYIITHPTIINNTKKEINIWEYKRK